jgi:hypothetical protein
MPTRRPRIFVAIASYRDAMLVQTVLHAFHMAAHPERVRFGIVDQCDPQKAWPALDTALSASITYCAVDAASARGVCWARNVAQSLWEGEEIYVQFDAHMAFKQGWDNWVEWSLFDRMATNSNVVLSSYPPSFAMTDDVPVIEQWQEDSVVHHAPHKEAAFEDGKGMVLTYEGCLITERAAPIRGYHLSAAVLIAPGRFVEAFPCDPFMYFAGEEQSLALRIFTHGWDIWHPVGMPIAHLYNAGGTRPLHWDDDLDAARAVRWWERDKRSYIRQRQLCEQDASCGVYGLGTARSLDDYAKASGVDYRARTIDHGIARAIGPHMP